MKYEICKPRDPRFIQMLIDEYNTTNISLHDLSLKYHTDAYYQFKIHNIPTRSKGEQRLLTRKGCIALGWDGKCITTEEQAYIAGLLLADGYVGENQVGLRLKKSDRHLVEQVKNYFSGNIHLQEEDTSISFVVSSKQLCRNLINLGIIRDKTTKELHIPPMDESLIRHFIRGYFDGDGSIYKNNNNGNISLRCNICSPTKVILDEINSFFIKNNIVGTINKETRIGKYSIFEGNRKIACASDMYRLFIRSKVAVEKLYYFLYDSATLYLERKKHVFDSNMELLIYQKPRKVYANTELTSQIA